LVALQLEYSLVERNIEREHIPAAQELGLGITPWSPLAGGFLTGKYKQKGETGQGEGRLEIAKEAGNPIFQRFTTRNWQILKVLSDVAKEINRPASQVSLNWVATQPGITSTIIGASKLSQLEDNLRYAEFDIPTELRARLEAVSAIETLHPYGFYTPPFQGWISGGTGLKPWTAERVYSPPSKEVFGAKAAAAAE
jgi:aryl-alcohol dehydrogenase-like predicted oxidoreductase